MKYSKAKNDKLLYLILILFLISAKIFSEDDIKYQGCLLLKSPSINEGNYLSPGFYLKFKTGPQYAYNKVELEKFEIGDKEVKKYTVIYYENFILIRVIDNLGCNFNDKFKMKIKYEFRMYMRTCTK